MITEYHDDYAYYYPAADYEALIEDIGGSYKGIGVYIYENEENGRITVMSAMKGSPAYEAGLQPGDEILQVDGEDVTKQTTEYVSSKFKSADLGTEFNVVINRPASGKLTLKIKVDDVEYPTVDSKMLDSSIGLIKISSFNMLTGDQFEEQYQDLRQQGMKGLIIDLRDNGGGEINAALQVANLFTEEGKNLMYMVTSEGTYNYLAEGDPERLPTLVLQNGNTASASEILIGALQDNNISLILGEVSFGKGIVQNIVPLDSGAGLRYTSARYLTAGGHEVHKIGITPTVEFAQPEGTDILASFRMDPAQDPQLARGVSEMRELIKEWYADREEE